MKSSTFNDTFALIASILVDKNSITLKEAASAARTCKAANQMMGTRLKNNAATQIISQSSGRQTMRFPGQVEKCIAPACPVLTEGRYPIEPLVGHVLCEYCWVTFDSLGSIEEDYAKRAYRLDSLDDLPYAYLGAPHFIKLYWEQHLKQLAKQRHGERFQAIIGVWKFEKKKREQQLRKHFDDLSERGYSFCEQCVLAGLHSSRNLKLRLELERFPVPELVENTLGERCRPCRLTNLYQTWNTTSSRTM
jgi:hypothetical protein